VVDLHAGGGLLLHHLEQVASTPDVVALAVEVLASALPFLVAQLLLLLLDPAELGDGEQPNCVQAHLRRSRDAHPAGGRVDAQMDVLDVLPHHLHADAGQVERCRHQYSFCQRRAG
jgi:hypothetical protein